MRDERERAAWLALVQRSQDSFGYFRTDQAKEAGVTHPHLRRLVRKGHAETIRRGIYRRTGMDDSWRSRLYLATQIYGGQASHLSAAVLHRLGSTRDLSPGFLEITTARHRSEASDEMKVYRREVRHRHPSVDGIAVGSVASCIVDLAAFHRFEMVRGVANEAVRKGLTTLDQIQTEAEFDAWPRYRSRIDANLSRLRPFEGRALSEWSVWAVDAIVRAGLPRPDTEVALRSASGDLIATVDLYWPRFRLVIELDGAQYHFDPLAFERDRARDAQLAGIGVVVLRVTWKQYQTPGYFERVVRQALAQRGENSMAPAGHKPA